MAAAAQRQNCRHCSCSCIVGSDVDSHVEVGGCHCCESIKALIRRRRRRRAAERRQHAVKQGDTISRPHARQHFDPQCARAAAHKHHFSLGLMLHSIL